MGKKEKRAGIWIIGINIILVIGIIAAVVLYTASYRQKLEKQNIADITNINQSSANISSAFLQSQKKRLSDTVQYILFKNMNYTDALTYINASNSDTESHYELIGTDAVGYASIEVDDTFAPVSYSISDYKELQKVFLQASMERTAEIRCTREFTDQYTACRSFAIYDYLKFQGDSSLYTLMEVFESSDFANTIELNGGYDGLATILVKQNGDYVLGASDFKSENLFDYFYDFSGLSLDEKNAAAEQFASKDETIFYYKNSKGQDCVYISAKVPDMLWYCVTCVPLSSFHSTAIDMSSILGMAILLLLLMGIDILWMKKANDKLRFSIQREMVASAAKTDFLARMSHDIRTPLNVIIGSVRIAQEEDNSEETKKYLNNIEQSGKFLLALVNDILDLNKVESGKMELRTERYSLKKLESSLRGIIAPLCEEKGISFRTSGFVSGNCYLLDPVRTNQIFFNLLSNSVKFTPRGGEIGIRCSVTQGADHMDELHFYVYDNGKGMSSEFQKHMYEAFSQEKQASGNGMQGTGLGLAIVSNLVRLMDGSIKVESAENKGTSFQIRIRAQRTEDTDEDTEETTLSLQVLKEKRVLLVEDNEINSEIATHLLVKQGMIVECAFNGKEAAEKFAESKEYFFDLILMDVRMPVMNGLDATRQIRAMERVDAKSIPIIAMTANAYDIDVQNCIEAGMNAHVSKPIDPDTMYAAIARFLTSC